MTDLRSAIADRFEHLALSAEALIEGSWRSLGGIKRFDAPVPPADPTLDVRWTAGPVTTARVRRLNQQPLRADRLRVTAFTPLVNFARVVIPDCGRFYVDSLKALSIRGVIPGVIAPNIGHPFFALDDPLGDFLLAFGLLNAPGQVQVTRVLPRLSDRRAMVGGDELLALTFEWTPAPSPPVPRGTVLDVDLFVCEDAAHWFAALERYTTHIRQREELVLPTQPAAWDAVWCTWTAFPSAEMTDRRVLANARIARDIGVRTVILDDGWFGPGLDDNAGVINHGDYQPDPRKFPDLTSTIRQMQALGLRVLLWHAPLCVAPAPGSKAADKLRHLLIRHRGTPYLSVNGMHQLCPACPPVRAHVANETRRLLETFGADGLKVDLYNCLPAAACDSTEHEHDIADPVLAVDAVMAAQWQSAKQFKPDVLIELKQDYGSIRQLRHGTMLRAGDTAYDMDTNLRRCAYAQAYAPCVHSDPLVTSIHDDPRNMSVMMVKALVCGAPTISIDLEKLPGPARERMAAYLRLYNDRRAIFRARRRPQDGVMNVWQGDAQPETFVAACFDARQVELPKAACVWVFNGTGRTALRVGATASRWARAQRFDDLLKPMDERRMMIESGTTLDVPVGGALRLDFE